ncbi:hypothetical protein AVDCRST_MAG94-4302 [uncultured Leptolyngbya sp.]|uniref:Phosphoadenosine phosphosulphate reductase domain-containing protein n=1 Tax=uncultured Leptolyngbya sp. TaxID=332963 RepID=A0A6J4MZ26_9CYAN|nr:hypothetical protein AVDCRST_MAG94-4302 [uncultured Leptolyngbya sp.]
MRHVCLISGKDSLATALLQTTHRPNLPYEFVFNDVGCELPETYAWLGSVEAATGWTIERIGQPLETIIEGYNGFLPGQRSRYCTREAKIQPLERWLGKTPAIVYYGLRADENRTGYVPLADAMITPAYPLQDAGIDLQGVYSILTAQNLLPPSFHWQRLEDAVSDRLCDFDWQSALQPWQRRSLFSGRSRGNCYLCFYQGQYELLWLLETHPDLFSKMAAFEKTKEQQPDRKRQPKVVQGNLLTLETVPESKAYTWRDGYNLTEFASDKSRQKQIFDRRVKEVSTAILSIIQSQSLGLALDTEIALTSCGLLCGK